MVRLLSVQEALSRWEEIVPRLERVLAKNHGEYALAHVQTNLTKGIMQLWVLEGVTGNLHSICVTELVDYNQFRACNIMMAEGSLDSRWAPAIEYIGRLAKEQGCVRLEALARPGWLKKAKQFGFGLLYMKIYKAL